MCPWWNLPDERVLDGDSLLFDDTVDNSVVKDLLFNYLTPENSRIDLMSSFFNQDGNDEMPENKQSDEVDGEPSGGINDSFDVGKAGVPMIEPRFGTKFWVESISDDTLQQWSEAASPQLPSSDLMLDLPPKNPFIPTNLDLKSLPGKHCYMNMDLGD